MKIIVTIICFLIGMILLIAESDTLSILILTKLVAILLLLVAYQVGYKAEKQGEWEDIKKLFDKDEE